VTLLTAPEAPAAGMAATFEPAALDGIVRHAGEVRHGMFVYDLARDDIRPTAMGIELGKSMDVAAKAMLAGTGQDALIGGAMALLEGEVDPVVKVLRDHDLLVTSAVNYGLGEQPRLILVHYVGRGEPTRLIRGFRAGLEQLGRRPQVVAQWERGGGAGATGRTATGIDDGTGAIEGK
jgi:hypothetical protein